MEEIPMVRVSTDYTDGRCTFKRVTDSDLPAILVPECLIVIWEEHHKLDTTIQRQLIEYDEEFYCACKVHRANKKGV